MFTQQGQMTLPEVNNALVQVEAQEAQLAGQQRLVQRELQRLETQQLILDQQMAQNEAAEEQLERMQAQLGGAWGREGVMPVNVPWQAGGVGWQGMGGWGTRSPRRSYLLAGVAMMAGLLLLSRYSGSLRPAAAGAAEEGE
jgi:hypothetical protein